MNRFYCRNGNDLLVIEENSDGVFLHTITTAGMWADSWHPNVAEAKEQARHQFEGTQNLWSVAPDDGTTLKDFVKNTLS
jgi:hypothetical protein